MCCLCRKYVITLLLGGYCGGVPPLPIPNREDLRRWYCNAMRESRKPPSFIRKPRRLILRGFFCYRNYRNNQSIRNNRSIRKIRSNRNNRSNLKIRNLYRTSKSKVTISSNLLFVEGILDSFWVC